MNDLKEPVERNQPGKYRHSDVSPVVEPYDWAISFETRARELLLAGEYKPLVNYELQLGSEAELAVPTPAANMKMRGHKTRAIFDHHHIVSESDPFSVTLIKIDFGRCG